MSMREIQVHERPGMAQAIPLSLQHLFAMFGASVLVPMLVGVDPSLQLLFNGIGTLLYIAITRGNIPAFLGPSAAFVAGIGAVVAGEGHAAALSGCIAVGILFVLAGFIVKTVGLAWLDIVLPPPAMGAVVATIGFGLAEYSAGLAGLIPGSVAPELAGKTIAVSLFTLAVAILVSTLCRGFLQAVPILIAVIAGYAFAFTQGLVDTSIIHEASWFAVPQFITPEFSWKAIAIILPAGIVVLAEHVGDLTVTERIVGHPLIRKENGLSRSYMGNGIGTIISSFFGGMPVTTYGENVGVMALTRVYSVWVIGGAAVFSICLAFIGKVSAVIRAMPAPVMGGVSILLFGMISASGLRMLVESRVDYGDNKNLITSAVILILAIGKARLTIGPMEIEGMALGAVVGVVLSLFFYIVDRLGFGGSKKDDKKEELEKAEAV